MKHPITIRQSLNVGVVLSHFEKSGVTSNTIDLCEGLTAIGHKVTLIVGRPETEVQKSRADYLASLGVALIFIPDVAGGIASRLRALVRLSYHLVHHRFDILHFESIYLTFIPALLRKRFVLTYHSYGLENNIFSRRATRLISISEGITADAIARHGYRREDIDIVPHGVSRRFAEPYTRGEQAGIRRSYGIPDDKTIIGIVARIEPCKGHHFLLEAISLLPAQMRESVHIVFCGNYKDPDSEQWLAEQTDRFNLADRVTILGFQDPLPVYRALDIFVLPSVWEGFALTPIEAMLAGCCVIRSDTQGSKEQIIEEETGFTFDNGKPDELAAKLHYILSHPEIIPQIASRARSFALERFTLETMARNTANVYYKTIKTPQHRKRR